MNRMFAAALIAAFSLAGAAQAQAPFEPPSEEVVPPMGLDAPDADTPVPESEDEQQRLLNSLFQQLGAAPSNDGARLIEQAIWRLWLVSGSDTIDHLMTRVVQAMQGEDWPLALDLLNAVVDLKPDYAEGWNKRATVLYALKDYPRALRDVERTLALEPRHFGALTGMGLIFNDVGDKARALDAFRRALAIHPNLSAAKAVERELEEAVEGREI